MKRADFVENTCSDTCNAIGIPGQVTDKSRRGDLRPKRQENVAALAHGIVPAHSRVNLTEGCQDDQELETPDMRGLRELGLFCLKKRIGVASYFFLELPNGGRCHTLLRGAQ